MKKLFLLVSIFTAIAYQLAHARDYYGYERVGRDASDYITIDGVRYARVPQGELLKLNRGIEMLTMMRGGFHNRGINGKAINNKIISNKLISSHSIMK